MLLRTQLPKGLLANFIGATLDKCLPFVITIVLVRVMANAQFGLWIEYFQVLMLAASSLMSPLKLFFSKDFFKMDTAKVYFYNAPIIAIVVLITWLVIYIGYPQFLADNFSVELIALILLYIVYSYVALYLRFEKKDKAYMLHSSVRFGVFVGALALFYFHDGEVSFQELVRSFILCHIVTVFHFRRVFKFEWRFNPVRLNEYFRLLFYGASTALLSGVDRLIVVRAGYSYEELGAYAYALSFASLPTFAIEAVKQYMSPRIFKNLSDQGHYSKRLKKQLVIMIACLIVVQLTVPSLALYFVDAAGFFKSSLIEKDLVSQVIFILNLGFIFHVVYHFINPLYFFHNKSLVLLTFQVLSIALFGIFVFTDNELSNLSVSTYRMLMYLLVVGLVVAYSFSKSMKSVSNPKIEEN